MEELHEEVADEKEQRCRWPYTER